MDNMKKAFAAKLLDVKAIKLQPNAPFTWASGWKSPFYCDNRKVLSFLEHGEHIRSEFTVHRQDYLAVGLAVKLVLILELVSHRLEAVKLAVADDTVVA